MIKKYGLLGSLRLLFDVFMTKLLHRECRLIRRPVYIRGHTFIEWGSKLTSGINLRIDVFEIEGKAKPKLVFGSNCQVNDYVHIGVVNSVVIGNDVLIASKVFITDHNHGDFEGDPEIELAPALRQLTSKPVTIEDKVWLGEGVMVLPGVTIGRNSIIGAGSIVTKNIPEYSIAVGTPAKVIKIFDLDLNKWIVKE